MKSCLDNLPPQTASQLRMLRRAALDVADGDLSGCCAAVACMIQGMLGGDIMGGKIGDAPHYWNRLPCGTEIDLTSCQFGGDGLTPLVVGEPAEKPEMTAIEFLMFAADVLGRLGRPFVSVSDRQGQPVV